MSHVLFMTVRSRPLREDAKIKFLGFPNSWCLGPNRGQGGHDIKELVQKHNPKTIGELNRLAATLTRNGNHEDKRVTPANVRGHLWWAWAFSCVEINGKRAPELPRDALA
jgi:hypothetical protein